MEIRVNYKDNTSEVFPITHSNNFFYVVNTTGNYYDVSLTDSTFSKEFLNIHNVLKSKTLQVKNIEIQLDNLNKIIIPEKHQYFYTIGGSSLLTEYLRFTYSFDSIS